MKYLKKFENAHKKYKKYIIYDDVRLENTISVYRVLHAGFSLVTLKPIFSYSNGKLEGRAISNTYYGHNIDTLKIYEQSDDPEYLIKLLPYIVDKNNFNL